ncbi:MAG: hydrogenase 4 subunit D [Armatimonadota bacterium]|nr:hydrogenase 4 subunit D [Armatimonadota bacterium]MCX7776588.1 hydrogenase 4 subunit D [Armatimonadota bacterium]MDW8025269.1 hydrogenase 4 subunit D [Armatimonadota bacterium]
MEMEEMVSWCILLIAVPGIGGIVCGLLPDRAARFVATLVSLATAGIGLWLIGNYGFEEHIINLGGLAWISKVVGTRVNLFGFIIDPLTSIMLSLIVVIGFLVVFYSTDYISSSNREHPVTKGASRYFCWMLLFIASMAGVAISSTFFQLFIFWELTTLCSWALISFDYDDPKAVNAGYKALLMTHVGGLFLMTAVVLLFASTRSFEFDAIRQLKPTMQAILIVLMFIGAWAKAAQFPFYTWLPDAMVAPTPVSAYLHAASMVKAGIYLPARAVLTIRPFLKALHPSAIDTAGILMAALSIITIVIGCYMFFYQDDLKRLLAFSTIVHLAHVLMEWACGSLGCSICYQSGLVHIIAHGVGKGLLFLSVGALAYATGTRQISQLSGAGSKMPLVAIGFLIGALTISGLPPFAGFWSKLYFVAGAITLGRWGIFFVIVGLIDAIIRFAWFIWVAHKVFAGEPSEPVRAASRTPLAINAAIIILILLCFASTPFAVQMAATAVGLCVGGTCSVL